MLTNFNSEGAEVIAVLGKQIFSSTLVKISVVAWFTAKWRIA